MIIMWTTKQHTLFFPLKVHEFRPQYGTAQNLWEGSNQSTNQNQIFNSMLTIKPFILSGYVFYLRETQAIHGYETFSIFSVSMQNIRTVDMVLLRPIKTRSFPALCVSGLCLLRSETASALTSLQRLNFACACMYVKRLNKKVSSLSASLQSGQRNVKTVCSTTYRKQSL